MKRPLSIHQVEAQVRAILLSADPKAFKRPNTKKQK